MNSQLSDIFKTVISDIKMEGMWSNNLYMKNDAPVGCISREQAVNENTFML